MSRNVKRKDGVQPDTSMLLRAATIVTERQKSYGDPYSDMARAAMIWSAILGIEVKPEQVALCMEGIKISRAVNGYHADNALDGCGYWQVYDTCATHDALIPLELR